MKKYKKIILVTIVMMVSVFYCFHDISYSQLDQITRQDILFTANSVGDADMQVTGTMTAQQWNQWKRRYGQNEHIIKRDFQHYFSAYNLSDFNLAKDDMNRKMKLTMRATGAVLYKGDNIWEYELEEEMQGQKLNDTQWLFNHAQNIDGTILQQNIQVKLPDGAKNSELTSNEFGRPVLRYMLQPEKQDSAVFLIVAITSLVLGLCAGLSIMKYR